MASYLLPPVYAAFVWWFSTGAVLLLVGLSRRFDLLRVATAATFVIVSLFGFATSSNEISTGAAYMAFTSTILLWGAQEIAFLAGWLTGPRAEPCPAEAKGLRRLGFALQAILFHEVSLLICGVVIAGLTWGAPNQVALWTFAALWILRQSSKINLFLGVPVTNDELMPEPVQFLKTYFLRKSVSAFFPISVTLACAVLVIMIQRIVEVAATPFEIASLTLVSTLFALGVVEHWFMLLPLPAIKLWSWGMRSQVSPEDNTMEQVPDLEAIAAPKSQFKSQLNSQIKPREIGARQRLEDQFRQRFIEQYPRAELATALSLGSGLNAGRGPVLGAEPTATINGRTS